VEVSRYQLGDAGWSVVERRGRHRVSGGLAALADGTPVLAQMYGENADLPGGVYALKGPKERVALPTIRGARAVRVLPDGRVAFADGWHKKYKAKGQGLVTLVEKTGATWRVLSRVQVEGTFGYNRLRFADLAADPGLELLAAGNGRAVVVVPGRKTVFHLGDEDALDAVPADLNGDGRPEVLIAGANPVIWHAE
jgi:hypothetical protein